MPRWVLGVLGLAGAPACDASPSPAGPAQVVPVVAGFFDSPGVYTTEDRWRFEGGIAVTRVRIEPTPLRSGQAATVSMDIAGVRGAVSLIVALQPPHAAARQVALGGVGAPPATVAADPRTTSVQVPAPTEAGRSQVTVSLGPTWHPQHAVVSLELVGQGARIAALQGPRTQAGVAVLGVVPVATQPTHVVAVRAVVPPTVDGILDEPVWAGFGTTLVQSLDGEPWDAPAGQVHLAWDDENFYAAATFVDRDVWSTLTQHDDPLWKEEVFELFVFGQAPAQRYLELQVSPRGVTFDARFASYRKGQEDWDSAWQTAVDLRGTLDTRNDRDQGWSVEVAVPWAEICAETAVSCPPRAGNTFRANAFRFERPAKGATVGLALSPTRVPDFHAADNAAWVELGQ